MHVCSLFYEDKHIQTLVCFVYTCVLYIYILIPRCCGFVSTHTSLPNGLLSCLVSCQVALCDTGVAQDHGGEPCGAAFQMSELSFSEKWLGRESSVSTAGSKSIPLGYLTITNPNAGFRFVVTDLKPQRPREEGSTSRGPVTAILVCPRADDLLSQVANGGWLVGPSPKGQGQMSTSSLGLDQAFLWTPE